MFDGISINDYMIEYEIQQAYFLRDCLEEEISYELKDSKVFIYKKLDNSISSEISLGELIFYIHTEVAYNIEEYLKSLNHAYDNQDITSQSHFKRIFSSIDNIKKAVENMKIILKYDDDSSHEDTDSESSKLDEVEKNKDNKTLAF